MTSSNFVSNESFRLSPLLGGNTVYKDAVTTVAVTVAETYIQTTQPQ